MKLQLECMGFKHILEHILVSEYLEVSPHEVMAVVSSDGSFSSLYPCMSRLASITFTLPVSTVDCKRGFSTIKTNPRNRLKTTNPDLLIHLSSEGPNFDFNAAVTV